jgi:hypothetical protein
MENQMDLDGIRTVRKDANDLLVSGGNLRPEQVLQRMVLLCDAILATPVGVKEVPQQENAPPSKRKRMDEVQG